MAAAALDNSGAFRNGVRDMLFDLGKCRSVDEGPKHDAFIKPISGLQLADGRG